MYNNGCKTICIFNYSLAENFFNLSFLFSYLYFSLDQFLIGDGNNVYDFTYVENVAHAHICADRALVSEKAAGEVPLKDSVIAYPLLFICVCKWKLKGIHTGIMIYFKVWTGQLHCWMVVGSSQVYTWEDVNYWLNDDDMMKGSSLHLGKWGNMKKCLLGKTCHYQWPSLLD